MKRVDKKTPYLYEHKGIFWYRRPIPKGLRQFTGGAVEFKRSLRTSIWEEALFEYFAKRAEYEDYIENCMNGSPVKEFKYYQKKAIVKGFDNDGLRVLLSNPNKTITYYKEYKKKKIKINRKEEYLTLFNARESDCKISNIVDYFIERQKYDLDELNTAELRKKRNSWRRSISVLMDCLKDDKIIVDITKSDAKKFEEYIRDMLNKHVITSNTANRHVMNIRTLISTYLYDIDRGRETVFDKIKFQRKNRKKKERESYSVAFIKKKWLTGDPFKEMHPEAKAILFAMLDTGCGFKELCGLDPEKDIKLNDAVPHIIVRANDNRRLKSDYRERYIPLIGYSLEAFKSFPRGFGRYAHDSGPDAASSAVRKYLRENDLNQSNRHSPICIRHLFKDRMRRKKFPEELQYYLMGHEYEGSGKHYGSFDLETIAEYMNEIEKDFE